MRATRSFEVAGDAPTYHSQYSLINEETTKHTQRRQQPQTCRASSDTDDIVDLGGLAGFRGEAPPPCGNYPGPARGADVRTKR